MRRGDLIEIPLSQSIPGSRPPREEEAEEMSERMNKERDKESKTAEKDMRSLAFHEVRGL